MNMRTQLQELTIWNINNSVTSNMILVNHIKLYIVNKIYTNIRFSDPFYNSDNSMKFIIFNINRFCNVANKERGVGSPLPYNLQAHFGIWMQFCYTLPEVKWNWLQSDQKLKHRKHTSLQQKWSNQWQNWGRKEIFPSRSDPPLFWHSFFGQEQETIFGE